MTGIFIFIGFLAVLIAGYALGKFSVAKQCRENGGFIFWETEYICTHFENLYVAPGKPEALRGFESGPRPNCAPFAEKTLDKVKFLDPETRKKLSGESERRPFFTNTERDCHACYRENGEMPSRMVLCPKCGNKRCPKAQDHRYQCTRSNEVGQMGILDGEVEQKSLNGESLVSRLSRYDQVAQENAKTWKAKLEPGEQTARLASVDISESERQGLKHVTIESRVLP
ncbi:hypothetical protein [Acinetobacter indicus]|uniref:hypothetical protein n=1 Tax=Acinetobacter indicus TaxID=756892 RepID=UPI00209B7125|nr:hypothetical protein [Acinetobacter indicus]MCO8088193.1 hypothetical protein [Acinetobacter indicus]